MVWEQHTHQVENQAMPLGDIDLLEIDPIVASTIKFSQCSWVLPQAQDFAHQLGLHATRQLAIDANRYVPELKTHDRYGNRIDEVTFHPAWHQLMALATGFRLHNLPWFETRPGAHQARSALFYLFNQVEHGVACPMSMTNASVPTLRHEPEVFARIHDTLLSDCYDPAGQDWTHKKGLLIGMAMTEKQGGSDVRSNTTRALPQSDGSYRLIGHKWFCSAPMCDGFLTLAQLDEGLSCFFVPRWLGSEQNRIAIQRLKDKLGNRSNASSEIEYDNAWAQRIGEAGRGVATILEMVAHTRLDCAVGSLGIMRAALVEAINHARSRRAFGKRLIEQPAMVQVLADLALEWEAAFHLVWMLSSTYDSDDPAIRDYGRLLTAIAKFWICKRTPMMVNEALECLGGAGYVEESVLARLYREAPLNSIWEGSGNVIALDIMRTLGRFPATLDCLLEGFNSAMGIAPAYDQAVTQLRHSLSDPIDQSQAREVAVRVALLVQSQLMLQSSDLHTAQTFISTRLTGGRAQLFGSSPIGDPQRIIDRCFPCG